MLPDREVAATNHGSSRDDPGVICDIGKSNELVYLIEGHHIRYRDEVASPEPADLALDATFFMGTVEPGETEERVEPVMGTQRYEPFVLPPFTSQEHLDHGRFEIVVADPLRNPTKMGERQIVALIERFPTLVAEHMMERFPRSREPHHEHPQPGPGPIEPRIELTEIDLRLLTKPMGLGYRDLPSALPQFGSDLAHVGPHG